jgi:hypothetical protein
MGPPAPFSPAGPFGGFGILQHRFLPRLVIIIIIY